MHSNDFSAHGAALQLAKPGFSPAGKAPAAPIRGASRRAKLWNDSAESSIPRPSTGFSWPLAISSGAGPCRNSVASSKEATWVFTEAPQTGARWRHSGEREGELFGRQSGGPGQPLSSGSRCLPDIGDEAAGRIFHQSWRRGILEPATERRTYQLAQEHRKARSPCPVESIRSLCCFPVVTTLIAGGVAGGYGLFGRGADPSM